MSREVRWSIDAKGDVKLTLNQKGDLELSEEEIGRMVSECVGDDPEGRRRDLLKRAGYGVR